MFKELKGLERELYLENKIEQLRLLYLKTQKKLIAQLKDIDLSDFKKQRTEAILKQVNQNIVALNGQCYKWAKSAVPYSYERGIDISAERLKALGITRFVKSDAQIHTSAINILVDDISIDLITANQTMKKNFTRFIRMTQQRILEDKEISKAIAEGLIKGEARRATSDRILNQLKKKMNNEQFITINGRNYRPDSYSELVARTRTREATTQGSINTALHYRVDLVQLDAHAEVCSYCQQFSGRVYSISGNHPEFPMLVEKPPFHPNCKCVLLPITEESLKDRGYYDSLVKLSNSTTIKVDSFSRFEELVRTL